MNPCDEFKGLLVGMLDHELTPEETCRTNEHLVRCAACRADYERLRETSGKLAAMSFAEQGDAIIQRVWRSPFSRLTRNSALWMIIGGYAGLIGYALVAYLRDDTEALPGKIGLAAIVIGFVLLFGQVIRERLCTYKTDPYKEIER